MIKKNKNKKKNQRNTKSVLTDPFFKIVMNNEIAAKEFLHEYLTPRIRDLLDLSTIKIEKESYIEDHLQDKASDVILSVRTKNNTDCFVYCLCEQQSKSDYFIAFRLMKYSLLLCDRHVKKKEKLPIVIPIVIYNGKAKYTAPRNIFDLHQDQELAKEIANSDYRFVDLQSMSDEELKRDQHINAMEFFMKHIYDKNLIEVWKQFLENYRNIVILDKEMGYVYINMLFWYTNSKLPEEQKDELNKLITSKLEDGEKIMRTIADTYIDEGIKIGIQQGIEQGIEQGEVRGKAEGERQKAVIIAKKMLSKNHSIADIADLTGLSFEEINNLSS